MTRSSRSITLVLVSCGVAALGFGLWNRSSPSHPTTRPYHGGTHIGWWGRTFGGGWGGSGYNSAAAPSHTTRGGFGSSAHSVSS